MRAIIIVSLLVAGCKPAIPKVVASPSRVEVTFKRAPAGGVLDSTAVAEFNLTNVGGQTLKFGEPSGECGCVNLWLESNELKPGTSAKLLAKFNHNGPARRIDVKLPTNDSEHETMVLPVHLGSTQFPPCFADGYTPSLDFGVEALVNGRIDFSFRTIEPQGKSDWISSIVSDLPKIEGYLRRESMKLIDFGAEKCSEKVYVGHVKIKSGVPGDLLTSKMLFLTPDGSTVGYSLVSGILAASIKLSPSAVLVDRTAAGPLKYIIRAVTLDKKPIGILTAKKSRSSSATIVSDINSHQAIIHVSIPSPKSMTGSEEIFVASNRSDTPTLRIILQPN